MPAPNWPFSLAYYKIDRTENEPELRLYSNRVVDSLTFKFGDYSIDASLSELELLPRPDCRS